MRRIILIILVLVPFAAKSQSILSGKVLDSLTREPLPYVNVFFANTTIGTVTNAAGEFTIRSIPSGKYDLTASFVGYTTLQLPLDFSRGDQQVTLYLSQQVVKLKEVMVRAKMNKSDWNKNYKLFKEHFLGTTRNASHTEITNPRNLNLYFDSADHVLVGHAKSDVEIENRALGYKLFYELVKFEIDYKNRTVAYGGIPRFEALTPKNKGEQKRWEEERKRAYYGSFSHFLRTLKENELEKNNFEVYELFNVPNRNRPDEAYLQEKIKYWKEKTSGNYLHDSLIYYAKLQEAPQVVDSIGKAILNTRELFVKGTADSIGYKGILRVTYKGEKEELRYVSGRPQQPVVSSHPQQPVQTSIIHFLGKTFKVYDNGYYENVDNLFFLGYMGWSEKIAELLPLEYVPEDQ
jgi:hypothetical protein